MQFVPFEDDIEVNGQTAYTIIDGFKTFRSLATRYLLENGVGVRGEDGVVKIEPEGWYSQAAWLKAFESIAKEIGDTVLFQIGEAIPRNAIFPPWVVDIHSAVKSIDIAYHINHRKNGKQLFDTTTGEMTEGIGHYGYKAIDNKNMIVCECDNPYPCDFDRGIISTMAKKFELKAQVIHDDSKSCRKNGADSCTYIVTW